MKSFNLIVPIAADKAAYEHEMPYVFGLNKNGIMHCVNSILGLNLSVFDHIYFTILSKHEIKYELRDLLNLQLKRLGLYNAKVTILEEPTRSQPETVYKTIKQEHISGSVFIKDADGYFACEVKPVNSIAIFPLEELSVVDPQNKSYVVVDDMFYITNIIEKKIISHYFNAGGVCFENVDDFCKYYNQVSKYGDKIYVSHVIYSMLLDKKVFRPILVENYEDFGNEKMFNLYLKPY